MCVLRLRVRVLILGLSATCSLGADILNECRVIQWSDKTYFLTNYDSAHASPNMYHFWFACKRNAGPAIGCLVSGDGE